MPARSVPGDWPAVGTVRWHWTPLDVRHPGAVLLAHVPGEIADVRVAVPASVAAITAEADAELARLGAEFAVTHRATVDSIAAHLLRAESLSSSRIEGLDVSARRLAEAAFAPSQAKARALEIAANVDAMRRAIELGAERDPLTVTDVLDLHAVLMAQVPFVDGGVLRDRQNWIGRSNDPRTAVYVPPPPAEVPRLLDDLVAFANRRDLSASLQAAIAHAQFEGIHPFVDGNGRVGRCLIGAIVRKRTGVTVFPPVSGEIRRDIEGYFAALRAYQAEANPWPWAERFAAATIDACATARRAALQVEQLLDAWRDRIGRQRRGSSVERLVELLPAATMLNVASAAELLGADPETARRALNTLEQAGVLQQVSLGRRNRVWRAAEMHALLDAL